MRENESSVEQPATPGQRPAYVADNGTGFHDNGDGTVQVLRSDQPACTVPLADVLQFAAQSE